jgi:hypothetical protein
MGRKGSQNEPIPRKFDTSSYSDFLKCYIILNYRLILKPWYLFLNYNIKVKTWFQNRRMKWKKSCTTWIGPVKTFWNIPSSLL